MKATAQVRPWHQSPWHPPWAPCLRHRAPGGMPMPTMAARYWPTHVINLHAGRPPELVQQRPQRLHPVLLGGLLERRQLAHRATWRVVRRRLLLVGIIQHGCGVL